MYVCINGDLVTQEKACLSPFDHGYLYGVGLFETFRVYNKHPFLFDDHLERLNSGLRKLGIRVNHDRKKWLSLVSELLKVNQLEDAYVRLNVSAGAADLGLRADDYVQPTIILFAKPLTNAIVSEKQGVFLKTVRNTPETPVRLKSHHFINNMLAKREIGHDVWKEGIFLTEKGHVAEGIVSNVFWIKQGVAYTPAVETGILNGVTRQFVIALFEKHGISCRTGFYAPEHVYSADEAFMTNSIQEIVPFSEIEGKNFPGNDGEITRILQDEYRIYREYLWSRKQL